MEMIWILNQYKNFQNLLSKKKKMGFQMRTKKKESHLTNLWLLWEMKKIWIWTMILGNKKMATIAMMKCSLAKTFWKISLIKKVCYQIWMTYQCQSKMTHMIKMKMMTLWQITLQEAANLQKEISPVIKINSIIWKFLAVDSNLRKAIKVLT